MRYLYWLLLSVTFVNHTLCPSDRVWYLSAIEKTPFSYKNKCRLIDVAQTAKKAAFFMNGVISPEAITQKRLHITQYYLEKEIQIITELAHTIGLSDAEWQQCLNTIQTVKQLSPSTNNVFHDPALLTEHLVLLTTILNYNGIDPNTINIVVKKSQEEQTYACASIALSYTYSPSDFHFIQNPRITQTLTIFENSLTVSASDLLAIFAHEVEHLYRKDALTSSIIEQYLQHYHQKGRDYLKTNAAFQKLTILYEAYAEIFAALKNADAAQALVDMRAQKYYPNHLYEAHYHDLVEINNLWKAELLS